MRRAYSLLILAALSCAVLLSVPRTATAAVASTAELGGRHWRFESTSNGPVHVWVPAGYDPAKAITVVHMHGDAEGYVGGYTAGKYSDKAWTAAKMAEQFNATGLNAMFIFPDGPIDRAERDVHKRVWKSLDSLLTAVQTQVGQTVPERVVVSGHSGAYETMHHWTGNTRVVAFALLDSMYDSTSAWSNWFNGGSARRLAIVYTKNAAGTNSTYKNAQTIAKATKAVKLDSIPGTASDLAQQAGANRAASMNSQFSHSDIIRLGRTIPVVLPWVAGTAAAQAAGTSGTSGASGGGTVDITVPRITAPLPASYGGPRLEIPIPGVDFTDAIRTDGSITFPWIAQYIGGVYTFLISIVGLVAAVVMVVGGFQYMTAAGDKNKLGAGKKRIRDALTGLVLALGSYTILFAINPNLVAFDGLQVLGIQTVIYESDTVGDITDEEIAQYEASAALTIPGGTAGKVPLYKQFAKEYRVGNGCSESNMSSSGCGPTSVAMVMSYYGPVVSPLQVEMALREQKYRRCNGGTSSNGFSDPKVVGRFGFTGHKLKTTQAAVVAQLQKGRPVVAGVGAGIFTAGGHYIVLTSIDAEGNVAVNDPNKSAYDAVYISKRTAAAHAKWPYKQEQCPGGVVNRKSMFLCKARDISPAIPGNKVPGSYVWPVLKSAYVILPAGQSL